MLRSIKPIRRWWKRRVGQLDQQNLAQKTREKFSKRIEKKSHVCITASERYWSAASGRNIFVVAVVVPSI